MMLSTYHTGALQDTESHFTIQCALSAAQQSALQAIWIAVTVLCGPEQASGAAGDGSYCCSLGLEPANKALHDPLGA